MEKKRVFSGIQPSGIPTIGNYFGAISRFSEMQDENDCLFCVVDLHTLTQRFEPDVLRNRTRYLFALFLAAGIEMEKSTLFIQSQVPQHAELAWILSCYTMFGELSRMTQFKEKSQKNPENINTGLFNYPVLMAADIALYDTAYVPVGEDQKQHVEIARDICERFNSVYGSVLTVPQPVMPKVGGRIMSLVDPTRKMDKSDPNPQAFISLVDDKDTIIKKFKKAVTDSDSSVHYDTVNKAGVSNLMEIYSLATGKTIEETENIFAGQGYGVFKPAVGEAVDAAIEPVRRRVSELMENPALLDILMKRGNEKAAAMASFTLNKVKKAVGLVGQGFNSLEVK